MHIIYIHKEEVHKRPPVLSVLNHLSALGQDVDLITCGINSSVKAVLNNNNINVYVLPYCKAKHKLGKLKEYILFRRDVFRLIKKIYRENSVLWIEAGATIVSLGEKINSFRHILQIQELHESEKTTLRSIKRVIGSAHSVFMPEYNRCVLYQIWFQLKKRPILLPNVPAYLPSLENLKSYETKHSTLINQIQGKKLIIYQGYISMRRPLDNYIKAVKCLGNPYQILLVGQDCGKLEDYKKILPNIIHIPYVPSPEYLFFTKLSYIGIVSYDPLVLNNAYCAPNKIFEYAHYGLPMIGNDIPGLKYMIESYQAGMIVDDQNVENIIDSIKMIDANYPQYSSNATVMLNSFNNQAVIKSELEKIEYSIQ